MHTEALASLTEHLRTVDQQFMHASLGRAIVYGTSVVSYKQKLEDFRRNQELVPELGILMCIIHKAYTEQIFLFSGFYVMCT